MKNSQTKETPQAPSRAQSTGISGPSDFLKRSARAELSRLQDELALRRGILRDQRRTWWEPDRIWQVRKVESMRKTKAEIMQAETALTKFIQQHKIFLGEIPNNGRLCWHGYLGCLNGKPIDHHYCQLSEGHAGDHQNSAGSWSGWPKHPISKPIISKPLEIAREKRWNSFAFGFESEWGQRTGPCILFYRDQEWYQHPFRRGYSCLGCIHLNFSDDQYHSPRCAHPDFLAEYGCAQAIVGPWPKCLTTPCQCPALPDNAPALTQPYPYPIHGLDSRPDKPEKVFKFTKQLRDAIRPLQNCT